jgi:hypothetical protein
MPRNIRPNFVAFRRGSFPTNNSCHLEQTTLVILNAGKDLLSLPNTLVILNAATALFIGDE